MKTNKTLLSTAVALSLLGTTGMANAAGFQLAEYSALADEFAHRTYDQSGNYTVNAFNLNLSNPVGSKITDNQGIGTILNDD